MLKALNKNRLGVNKKGQLAPIFIAVLVVLILMALVTVNVGKIAMIKTESANSVDGGALAGGSVMANTFNATARASEKMEQKYWSFLCDISWTYNEALDFLLIAVYDTMDALMTAVEAIKKAFPDPGGAAIILQTKTIPKTAEGIANLAGFMKTDLQIQDDTNSYYDEQKKYYKKTRKMAADGRDKAIELAQKYAFMNSGIGQKLAKKGQGNNSQEKFKEFIKNIKAQETCNYDWADGQKRQHKVEVKVKTQDVKTFKLITTLRNLEEELASLDEANAFAGEAIKKLEEAKKAFEEAVPILLKAEQAKKACEAGDNWACVKWKLLSLQATLKIAAGLKSLFKGLLTELMVPLPTMKAWGGLTPQDQAITSDGGEEDSYKTYIICWINDIVHDRLIRVDTKQEHEGSKDLSLFQTKYPQTISYSVVSFKGHGLIDFTDDKPREARFDASIIETDTDKGEQGG